jgi:hypothetical protein
MNLLCGAAVQRQKSDDTTVPDLHRLPAFSAAFVCTSLSATWEGNEEKPNIMLPFDQCGPFTSMSETCGKSSDIEIVRTYRTLSIH